MVAGNSGIGVEVVVVRSLGGPCAVVVAGVVYVADTGDPSANKTIAAEALRRGECTPCKKA
jgi:hypothetical protein